MVKLEKNIPTFYHEMLNDWKKLRDKVVSTPAEVLNELIWYNTNIKIDNRPIYDKQMANSGIQNIAHLCKADGNFKTFTELSREFSLHNSTFMTYAAVIGSIP